MDEQVIERIKQQPPGMQRVVAFLDELGNRVRADVQRATQAGSKEEAVKIFEEAAEEFRTKQQIIAEALVEQPESGQSQSQGQSQGQQRQGR